MAKLFNHKELEAIKDRKDKFKRSVSLRDIRRKVYFFKINIKELILKKILKCIQKDMHNLVLLMVGQIQVFHEHFNAHSTY